MAWLVTGGAGYIGAHVVDALRAAGHEVVVFDDLSSGFAEFVPEGVPLIEGRIEEQAELGPAFDEASIEGVVHLAGLKYPGESVVRPLDFYRVNVEGTRVLLATMAARGVERLVFSSSCSVYGTVADGVPVTEGAPTRPESPYGESKLIGEWLIRAHARANPSFRHTSLRYFNVVGSGERGVADHSPYNLFPLALRAIEAGRPPSVFGDDYPTRDGTCIRDYVHVVDLADAHARAAAMLDADERLASHYNVGRGEGISVREIVDHMLAPEWVEDVGMHVVPRRPGDPAAIVGDAERIERDFGWRPARGIDEMVQSAWAAWRRPAARERERETRR